MQAHSGARDKRALFCPISSVPPTTGMEAVKLLSSVNIPAKQKLAQTAVNVLGSLVINIEEKDKNIVEKYLKDKDFEWEVI